MLICGTTTSTVILLLSPLPIFTFIFVVSIYNGGSVPFHTLGVWVGVGGCCGSSPWYDDDLYIGKSASGGGKEVYNVFFSLSTSTTYH